MMLSYKKERKKYKKELSNKSKKYAEIILEKPGISRYQAAIQANYSHNTAKNASRDIEKPAVLNYMEEFRAKARKLLTPDRVISVVSRGLDADRPSYRTKDGELVEGGPDWSSRDKFVGRALELTGMKSAEANTQNNLYLNLIQSGNKSADNSELRDG